jgi:hypothetical protein
LKDLLFYAKNSLAHSLSIYAIFTLCSVEDLHMSILGGKLIQHLFNRMLLEKGLSVTMSSKPLDYSPRCASCGKSIGDLTPDEKDYFWRLGDSLLCFGCDPESSATTPSLFWQWREGDSFTIGGEQFEVWALPGKAAELVQSHAHARARARGLSSSTYLNRTQKNRALLSNGLEIQTCKKCRGTGELDGFAYVADCDECKGLGTIASAIYIPSWLIEEGENNV